jgi:hypothetical protein
MKRPSASLLASTLLASAAASAFSVSSQAVPNPEADTLALSKKLKPIPDETWKSLAGSRIGDQYTIEKGDTLWDVSKRLFGDPTYWPKVWALNNASITNPHHIRPGKLIAFMPGSGTALPSVALNDAGGASIALSFAQAYSPPAASGAGAASDADSPASDNFRSAHPERSREWRNLPKQPWESVTVQMPPKVDRFGFLPTTRQNREALNGFELEKIVYTEEVDSLGKIIGSQSEGKYLTTGDLIFVRPLEGPLTPGQIYTLVDEPEKVRTGGRKGWVYAILGDARVEREEEGRFLATVTRGKGIISRDSYLIPFVPRVKDLAPVPGTSALRAQLTVDRYYSTYVTVQHNHSFVNRGTEDGVRPGMVFRAYLHRDPVTDRKLLDGDGVGYADFIVVHASERFCTVIGFSSQTVVPEDTEVVLLTDVSSLSRGNRNRSKEIDRYTPKTPGGAAQPENDELDKLGGGDSLGDEEKKELKQLEDWKGNPAPTPLAPPETAPASPGENEVPPPPSGELPSTDDVVPPPATDPVSPPPSAIEPEAVPTPEAQGVPTQLSPPSGDELPAPPSAPEGFEPPKPNASGGPEDF